MFKITWDSETGGVLLSSKVTKETLGISPRPVFFEELDLLGLDRLGWTYPREEAPIMWAVNKQYWYRGTMLFEAKGANIYDAPTVAIAPGVEPMTLTAIDVDAMLAKNTDQMFLIESEAIEFIRDTFVAYSKVNRAHDTVRANQEMDFEAIAAKVEKKTKTKMAVARRLRQLRHHAARRCQRRRQASVALHAHRSLHRIVLRRQGLTGCSRPMHSCHTTH